MLQYNKAGAVYESKTVGLAIAMGDATDELKAVADYVTLDVDHSGLAEAIDKFLL